MTRVTDTSFDRASSVATASIAVAIGVMGLKYIAYLWTDSVALYSDALESIVNVITAIAALAAVRVGARPADRSHPFGHHKAEYFSAVLGGSLIIVAALLILREAYGALFEPRMIDEPAAGLAMNALASVLNATWAWFLINRGRTWRSPALVADGWHLATDVWTSVGVLAGLVLATLTGWAILDPLLATAVAANILWAGYKITIDSMGGLMDESVSAGIEAQIRVAIKSSGGGALEAHDIRTRRAGRATFIEFHLVVPGTMTVSDAHDICDRIEHKLEAEIEGSDVSIHLEPDSKAKGRERGTVVLSGP